jgi:hypothetical protein
VEQGLRQAFYELIFICIDKREIEVVSVICHRNTLRRGWVVVRRKGEVPPPEEKEELKRTSRVEVFRRRAADDSVRRSLTGRVKKRKR